jgi:hypothetical protein
MHFSPLLLLLLGLLGPTLMAQSGHGNEGGDHQHCRQVHSDLEAQVSKLEVGEMGWATGHRSPLAHAAHAHIKTAAPPLPTHAQAQLSSANSQLAEKAQAENVANREKGALQADLAKKEEMAAQVQQLHVK